MQTTATIVIPSCNRPKELASCLNALKPQVAADGALEVLVMDDGDTPTTAKLVKSEFPWAAVHGGPRRGPAANRNLGASIANGLWVIFLDDDCLPRPNFVASYRSEFEKLGTKEETVFVGPTFRSQTPASLLWEAPHNPSGQVMISCNFAIKRSFFFSCHGFDERFPSAAFEDTEFEARVRASGGLVQFVPNAVVSHPLRRIPGPAKLAKRWEARVISTFDLGIAPNAIARALSIHVAKVVVSRFRGVPFNIANAYAAFIFIIEFALVLASLERWKRRYKNARRSVFWQRQVVLGKAPPRFGL